MEEEGYFDRTCFCLPADGTLLVTRSPGLQYSLGTDVCVCVNKRQRQYEHTLHCTSGPMSSDSSRLCNEAQLGEAAVCHSQAHKNV